MPALDFKGKQFVYSHHLSVPFRDLVMNADGASRTRLIQNSFLDSFPARSPDGSRIAFAYGRAGGTYINALNARRN